MPKPDGRYEVRISANNQFGYGVESDAAILSTKAQQVRSRAKREQRIFVY